ncbi:MAG: Bacterial domain [Verrucomicrobiota bacterium]|jgi:uncharacterized protein YgiM (DUF1202 family)
MSLLLSFLLAAAPDAAATSPAPVKTDITELSPVALKADVSALSPVALKTDAAPLSPVAKPADPSSDLTQELICEGKVTGSRLNLRPRPGTRFEVLGHLKRDDKVQVLARHKDWLQIASPAGMRCWVSVKSLDAGKKSISTASQVHAGPGVAYTEFGEIAAGTAVKVLSSDDTWAEIEPAAGAMKVWASSAYIAIKAPVAALKDPVLPDAHEKEAAELRAAIAASARSAAGFDQQSKDLGAKEDKLNRSRVAAEEQEKRIQDQLAALKMASKSSKEEAAALELLREQARAAQADAARLLAEIKLERQHLDEQRERFSGEASPAPKIEAAPLIVPPGQVRLSGVVMPVDNTKLADAVLCAEVNGQYYPIAYLNSKDGQKTLQFLYKRPVEVVGTQRQQEGWSRPTLEIEQIRESPKP